jgi:hypothetical protein
MLTLMVCTCRSRIVTDLPEEPVVVINNITNASAATSDPAAPLASLDDISCPLRFDRLEYVAIREGTVKPYLLGGCQRPVCKNCKSERAWSVFCRFRFESYFG